MLPVSNLVRQDYARAWILDDRDAAAPAAPVERSRTEPGLLDTLRALVAPRVVAHPA